MTQPRKIALVFLGLLAAGAVRLPMEQSLTRELRAGKLLPEPLPISTREKIGQTGAAVALGGLRTLVATFYNLRAYTAFTEDRWRDAEESFETTVALAPATTYYWLNGGWHIAYNAGHYYQHVADLPPLRAREFWRASVHKGRSFLERGIRNNPHDWNIHAELGRLLSDPNKIPAFNSPAADGETTPHAVRETATYQAAADAYRAAMENGGPAYTARNWFYSLARIPGKEAEALTLGETLAKSRVHRTPTLMGLLFVLRMHADPARDPEALAASLFTDDQRAYHSLSMIWTDRLEHYPSDGLSRILPILEKRLAIPPDKRIFK